MTNSAYVSLFAATLATLFLNRAWIRLQLKRLKSKLISHFVNRSLQKMFIEKGGRLELDTIQRPDGTEDTYFKNAPTTLPDWFQLGAKHGQLDHIVYYGDNNNNQVEPTIKWTFDQVLDRANAFAYYLESQFHVKRGDRVSILMSNQPEFCTAFMSITYIEAIAVTLNAFWERDEIEFGLRDSNSTVLITDDKRLRRLSSSQIDSLVQNVIVFVVRPSEHTLNTLFAKHPTRFFEFEPFQHTDKRLPAKTIDPNTDAYLMYTSGTTSPKPKGVLHTHMSTVSTAMSFQVFVELLKRLKPSDKKRVDLVTGPLFHAATLCPVFLLSFHDAHKLVLIPKWETDRALQICLKEHVTFFGSMPTLLQDMLQSPFFMENKHRFAFTNIGTGGASTPSELILRLHRALPNVSQGSGWGLTETNSLGTVIGGPDYLDFPKSCGKPHPIVKLRVVDPDTLEDVASAGELLIQSVTNMRGYWNDPEETRKTLLPGNWIRSGDFGTIDRDGFVYVIDRIKDIVIRGGENISVSEVESCIYESSPLSISEVVCFGLPQERLGEQLCAVIVVPVLGVVNEDDVKKHCEQKLAKFKVPSIIVIRQEPLPRSAAGKILKRLLKIEYSKY